MISHNSPKVSIITITYNHENYIKQALDSFLAQKTDFDIEIVVADDASTDKTPEIIKQYAKEHPEIVKPILRSKNVGIQVNCIDAMQKLKGEYVAWCEGDDYWTSPQKLQRQADLMDANPDMALAFHPVKIVFEGSGQKSYNYPDPKPEISVEKLLEKNFIQSNSVMYRRQDYSSIPNDILPLDWYLHLYHAQFGKIGYLDEVMSVYRRHAGGIWWDAASDVAKIWSKFGVAHMSLYNEFLKLYGGRPNYHKIIAGLVINGFNHINDADRDLFLEVLSKYLKCAEIYIENLREQVMMLERHAKSQAEIIEHYQGELERTQNEVQALQHALNKSPAYKIKQIVKRRKT